MHYKKVEVSLFSRVNLKTCDFISEINPRVMLYSRDRRLKQVRGPTSTFIFIFCFPCFINNGDLYDLEHIIRVGHKPFN